MQSRSELATRRRQAPAKPATKVFSVVPSARLEAARFALPQGRSPDWLKFKNPAAPAVRREGSRGVTNQSPLEAV